MDISKRFPIGRSSAPTEAGEGIQRIPRTAKYAKDIDTIDDLEPVDWRGRLWDRPRLFILTAFLFFSLGPFVTFVAIGVLEGTLFLPGNGHGVLEATAFLTYFPTSFLMVIAAYRSVGRLDDTLNSLTKIARFESETTHLDAVYASAMDEERLEELFAFYEYVIAELTYRSSHEDVHLPENYKRTNDLIFRIPRLLFFAGGTVLFLIATEHHWNAVETYGFRLWSSQEFLLGFAARMVYDILLYVVMGPFIALRLMLSIYLMHHAMTRLQRWKGIRFLRFSIDEAGGFGEFGQQSLRNVMVLLPLIIPIVVSILFLPSNELTIVGIAIFLCSVPIVFFWPLLGARRSMVRMKQLEMEILADAYLDNYESYKQFLEETDTTDAQKTEELIQYGEALDISESIFNGVKDQPAWPFSRTLIGRFISLMAALGGVLLSALYNTVDLMTLLG
jgi:hypothetical protein